MNIQFQFKRAGLLAALLLPVSLAYASPCDSILSSYNLAVSSSNASFASILMENNPECFGASSTRAQVQINGTSFAQMSSISNVLQRRWDSDNPGPTAGLTFKGISAGNAGKKWNVWSNLDSTDTRQSARIGTTATFNKAESTVRNFVGGVDYSLSSNMVAGVSATYDVGNTGANTTGAGSIKNDINTRGYSVAPYFGMQISKTVSFDVSLGVGRGKFTSSAATAGDSDRWFGSANLNYERWLGNFQFAGKASYLRATEDYDTLTSKGAPVLGTAAKYTLGQARATAQAGYWISGFLPYVALGYVSDIERKTTQFGALVDPIGKNAWFWTVGANFISLSNGLTAGLFYRQEQGRTNQDVKLFSGNIAWRF